MSTNFVIFEDFGLMSSNVVILSDVPSHLMLLRLLIRNLLEASKRGAKRRRETSEARRGVEERLNVLDAFKRFNVDACYARTSKRVEHVETLRRFEALERAACQDFDVLSKSEI